MAPDHESPHLAHRERLALAGSLEQAGPDAPTLCDPWRTAQLAAHLVLRERRPDVAAGIVLSPLAQRTEAATWATSRRTPYRRLLAQLREGPPRWNPARLAPVDDLVNLVEFVVHHEDVLRGDGSRGPRRTLPPVVERALWSALRPLALVAYRQAPVGVVLSAPGMDPITAKKGASSVRVEGDVLEVLLTAYGRERVAEVRYAGTDPDVLALRSTRLGLP